MMAGDDEGLTFLPLGGVGEIGMNLGLYGWGGKWLMVDLGVSFGDDSMPMIDVVMPDPAWIEERSRDLVGLVITHAHEDHLGAVPYLWPRLKCPIYAGPFAAALLANKLHEVGLASKAAVSIVTPGQRFQAGPFDLEMVGITHSTPDSRALVIRTPAGAVVHTGDWKFDPDPLVGDTSDLEALRRLGKEGILALIGDSTNVFSKGEAGSEAEVRASLTGLFAGLSRRIAVSCFATNVARVESIALAAQANDRSVALVGRSLWRIEKAARSVGYLRGLPPFLTDHDAAYLPEDKVLYICTGSQGEPRAALAHIAMGEHPHVRLGADDACVFSSRIIPGNEKAIFRIQNLLAKRGVAVITEKDHFIHVSGHPAQDEMRQMYRLVRPKIAVPVHGEARHLHEHAALARTMGVEHAPIIENGQMLRLAPGAPEVIDHVPVGRLAVDGPRLVRLDSEVLRDRRRMVFNGSAVVTLVVDAKGTIRGEPQLTALGLLDQSKDCALRAAVIEAISEAVARLPVKYRKDDSALAEEARRACRRAFKETLGHKPVTEVHLVRL